MFFPYINSFNLHSPPRWSVTITSIYRGRSRLSGYIVGALHNPAHDPGSEHGIMKIKGGVTCSRPRGAGAGEATAPALWRTRLAGNTIFGECDLAKPRWPEWKESDQVSVHFESPHNQGKVLGQTPLPGPCPPAWSESPGQVAWVRAATRVPNPLSISQERALHTH